MRFFLCKCNIDLNMCLIQNSNLKPDLHLQIKQITTPVISEPDSSPGEVSQRSYSNCLQSSRNPTDSKEDRFKARLSVHSQVRSLIFKFFKAHKNAWRIGTHMCVRMCVHYKKAAYPYYCVTFFRNKSRDDLKIIIWVLKPKNLNLSWLHQTSIFDEGCWRLRCAWIFTLFLVCAIFLGYNHCARRS